MNRRESNDRGLTRLAPSDATEIEMFRRILQGNTGGKTPSGVTLHVGDHIDDGWYHLTAVKAQEQFDLMTRWAGPMAHGRISLLERAYPASEFYRLDLAWQYDGEPEYWGGDPLSNGALLLRPAREP